MRGTIAKRLRRQVYGDDYSSKTRNYTGIVMKRITIIDPLTKKPLTDIRGNILPPVERITINAGTRRKLYQQVKREVTKNRARE